VEVRIEVTRCSETRVGKQILVVYGSFVRLVVAPCAKIDPYLDDWVELSVSSDQQQIKYTSCITLGKSLHEI